MVPSDLATQDKTVVKKKILIHLIPLFLHSFTHHSFIHITSNVVIHPLVNEGRHRAHGDA